MALPVYLFYSLRRPLWSSATQSLPPHKQMKTKDTAFTDALKREFVMMVSRQMRISPKEASIIIHEVFSPLPRVKKVSPSHKTHLPHKKTHP